MSATKVPVDAAVVWRTLIMQDEAHAIASAPIPGATDATSADFPRAVCRRKAMERSGGVVTPPHSAGIYFLFGFFFFDVIVASSCSRLRSPFAGRPSRNRSLVVRLWSCAACVCVYVWGLFDAVAVALCFRRTFRSLVVTFVCSGTIGSAVGRVWLFLRSVALLLPVALHCPRRCR